MFGALGGSRCFLNSRRWQMWEPVGFATAWPCQSERVRVFRCLFADWKYWSIDTAAICTSGDDWAQRYFNDLGCLLSQRDWRQRVCLTHGHICPFSRSVLFVLNPRFAVTVCSATFTFLFWGQPRCLIRTFQEVRFRECLPFLYGSYFYCLKQESRPIPLNFRLSLKVHEHFITFSMVVIILKCAEKTPRDFSLFFLVMTSWLKRTVIQT